MASTYSTNLGIELIGTGDQSGTWGATTNTNLGTLLEQAIVGYATQAVTDSASPTVLAITNGASSTGRNYVITLTGALTANRTVEVPAVNKPYTFFNNTTGGYAVTVKVSGQTGVTIANGKKAIVYTNSTDVIEVANAPVTEAGTQTLTNKTLTDPLISTVAGGTTASSTLTLESTTGAGTSDSILFKTGSQSTRMTIDTSGNVSVASGNLTFAGTSQRITGDMTNSTMGNRLIFQTSTANGATAITAIPNGTAPITLLDFLNSSDTVNNSYARLMVTSTEMTLRSLSQGTGTYLPMTFQTGGSEVMRIGATAGTDKGTVGIGYSTLTGVGTNGLAVSGNVGIGTSSPSKKFVVSNAGAVGMEWSPTDYTNNMRQLAYNRSTSAYVALRTEASQHEWYNGGTEAARIDSSGNLLVGTTTLAFAEKFQVYGNYSVFNNASYTGFIGQGSSLGTATASDFAIRSSNALAFLSGGATERMRIDSLGRVQIGTTTAGIGNNNNTFLTVSGSTTVYSSVRASGGDEIQLLAQSGLCGVYTYSNSPMLFGTNNAERMRIDSSGNVGIGTSSPDANLSVFGSTAVAADVGGEISIGGFYNGSSKISYGSIAGVNQNGTGNTSGQLLFKTRTNFGSLTERMRIDSSGNVGIGTSSPANKLDVVGPGGGAIQATISDGANQGFIRISKSAALYGIGAGSDYGGVLFYSNNATERMRIDTNGNVGVGTSSPGVKLDVVGVMRAATWSLSGLAVTGGTAAFAAGTVSTDSNWGFYFRAPTSSSAIANYSFRNSSDTALMTIDASGNVIAGGSVALATTATNGFLYVPTCAGTPTGTPTTVTGMAPIVVNTTNNKLYFYSGGAWRDAGP